MKKRKINKDLPLSRLSYFVMGCVKIFLKFVCLFTKYQFLGVYENILFRKKGVPMWLVTGQPNQNAFVFKINMMWFRDKSDKELRTLFLLTCQNNFEKYMDSHPELFYYISKL